MNKKITCPNCHKEVNTDDILLNFTHIDLWYMKNYKMLCPHCKNELKYGEA